MVHVKLVPTFQLDVNAPILPGLATIGKFDGTHPCLTCATNAGKVFVHNPHQRDKDAKLEVRYLNINRKMTAITSGSFEPRSEGDTLFVGSETNLLAFDVEQNKDLFFRECADGVAAAIFKDGSGDDSPLVYVGGSCSILGYDRAGNEKFWTVTGDNVVCMAHCDVTDDGKQELVVGSEDFEIRIFSKEEVIQEITETDSVCCVSKVANRRFAYGLANGTMGLYDKFTRAWRVKSKNVVQSVTAFDIDDDGVVEAISGWNNGKIEARNIKSGEIVCKDAMKSGVAGLLLSDYRLDGRTELICCSVEGEVKGYLPTTLETRVSNDTNPDEELLQELNQRKQELLFELRNYEDNMRIIQSGKMQKGEGYIVGVPTDTKITCRWDVNEQNHCVDLAISVSNSGDSAVIIKAVIIFAEQLFVNNESLFVHPKTQASSIRIPITSPKDVGTDLFLKVLVGPRNSETHHVFEQTYKLPKFSMFVPLPDIPSGSEPKGSVSFQTSEKVHRLVAWLNNSFNISYSVDTVDTMRVLDLKFRSVRDGTMLLIQMNMRGAGHVVFKTEDMHLAGELIQDFCTYCQIAELESIANFEQEMEQFRKILIKVEEHNSTRMKMTADMADISNTVKSLVIKAEDSRLLGDMKLMRKTYTDLYDCNRQLIGEHVKRANNHADLLASLKILNSTFQKAARLRMGGAKSRVVQLCRQALSSNNTAALFKIIETGNSA